MKILLVNPSCWIYGGAERVIVQLANWLTNRHHEVNIITTEMCDDMRADLKEARLIFCDDFPSMHVFLQQIVDDFDIVNVHNDPGHLMVFPKKANVTWLCNEPPHHENPTPKENDLRCTKDFKVVVGDEFNAARFLALYKKKAHVINYGIDWEFFSNSDYGHPPSYGFFGLTGDDFVISQIGFIAPTKNQLRTIEIFKKIKEKIPHAKLVLAGKEVPGYLDLVRQKVAEYGLMGDVILTGFLPREKIRELYNISDCSIFPGAGQGNFLSVFESMSAGCPTFVADTIPCSSILAKNKIGNVCKSDEEFVESILEFSCTDKDKIAIQTVTENMWVEENLTWDKFCSKMFEVFNEDK